MLSTNNAPDITSARDMHLVVNENKHVSPRPLTKLGGRGETAAVAGQRSGIDFEMRSRVAVRPAGQGSFPGQGTPTRQATDGV
jgi:hypothetical protein